MKKSNIMAWLVKVVPPIVSIFQHPPKWPYSVIDLLKMPDGSLGKQTALLLLQKHWDFIPKYESHDCKHVLLDYEMNALGECRMVFFNLGNGNRTFMTYISVMLSLALYGKHCKQFMQDYQRGKQSVDIGKWDFVELMSQPCHLLRKQLMLNNRTFVS